PVLIAGLNALNDALPSIASTVSSVRPKATAEYVKRGFAADRHGEPLRHNCETFTGSTIVLLSVGASERNWMLPAPVRRSNTAVAGWPLSEPVCSAPRSPPTTT